MPLPPPFDPSKTKICKCFKYCAGGAWVTPRQLRYYANQVAPSVTRMQASQSVGITSGSCAPDTTSQQDGLNNYGNNFLDVDQDFDMNILDNLDLPQEHCHSPPAPPIPPITPVQPLNYDVFPCASLGNLALLQDMIANI